MTRAAAAALVLAAACWSTLSVGTAIALRQYGPLTLLAVQVTIAAGLLTLAARAAGQPVPRLGLPVLALGLLEPTLAYLSFDFGVQRTSSAHAGLLLGTETVFVVVLGLIALGERPRPPALLGVLLAVSGVVLLGRHEGGRAGLIGDLLVLLDTLAAAGYVVLAKVLLRDRPPIGLAAAQFRAGLLVVLPVAALAWLTGAEPPLPPAPAPESALALIGTGVVGTAAAFLLYTWALARVSAGVAGMAITIVPVFSLGLSALILAEPLTRTAIGSAALILVGLACFALAERSRSDSRSDSRPGGRIQSPVRARAGSQGVSVR